MLVGPLRVSRLATVLAVAGAASLQLACSGARIQRDERAAAMCGSDSDRRRVVPPSPDPTILPRARVVWSAPGTPVAASQRYVVTRRRGSLVILHTDTGAIHRRIVDPVFAAPGAIVGLVGSTLVVAQNERVRLYDLDASEALYGPEVILRVPVVDVIDDGDRLVLLTRGQPGQFSPFPVGLPLDVLPEASVERRAGCQEVGTGDVCECDSLPVRDELGIGVRLDQGGTSLTRIYSVSERIHSWGASSEAVVGLSEDHVLLQPFSGPPVWYELLGSRRFEVSRVVPGAVVLEDRLGSITCAVSLDRPAPAVQLVGGTDFFRSVARGDVVRSSADILRSYQAHVVQNLLSYESWRIAFIDAIAGVEGLAELSELLGLVAGLSEAEYRRLTSALGASFTNAILRTLATYRASELVRGDRQLVVRVLEGGLADENAVRTALRAGRSEPVLFLDILQVLVRWGRYDEASTLIAGAAERVVGHWSGCRAEAAACDRVDSDRDGLSDEVERRLGTNVESADSDDDGVIDGLDPCPLLAATDAGGGRRTELEERRARALTWLTEGLLRGSFSTQSAPSVAGASLRGVCPAGLVAPLIHGDPSRGLRVSELAWVDDPEGERIVVCGTLITGCGLFLASVGWSDRSPQLVEFMSFGEAEMVELDRLVGAQRSCAERLRVQVP